MWFWGGMFVAFFFLHVVSGLKSRAPMVWEKSCVESVRGGLLSRKDKAGHQVKRLITFRGWSELGTS